MKLNDTRNLNYTEITMRLTRIVNGGCLVEPLDLLAESSITQGGISFAKDPLGSGSSSFGVLPQCHHPVHLSVSLLSSNKTKHMFEPCTRYCHIHLACTSVQYERKMHVLIIQK